MKKLLLILILILIGFSFNGKAQQHEIDSLRQLLTKPQYQKDDTNRLAP